MIKIRTYETKFNSECDSWTWCINDIIVHETKNKEHTDFFNTQIKKLDDQLVTSLTLDHKLAPTAYVLRINNLPISTSIGKPGRSERIGKRLTHLFDLDMIDINNEN